MEPLLAWCVLYLSLRMLHLSCNDRAQDFHIIFHSYRNFRCTETVEAKLGVLAPNMFQHFFWTTFLLDQNCGSFQVLNRIKKDIFDSKLIIITTIDCKRNLTIRCQKFTKAHFQQYLNPHIYRKIRYF